MAISRTPPAARSAHVAARLADFLAEGPTVFGRALEPLQLAESFDIVRLERHADAPPDRDLRDDLVDTGQVHYQVLRAGEPIGYSVVHEPGDSDAVIDRYSESGDSAAIERAIDAIDASGLDDTYTARLLDVRNLHLGAVVLTSPSQPTRVVPFRVPLHQDLLRASTLYDSTTFARALDRFRGGGGLKVEPAASDDAAAHGGHADMS